MHSNIQCINATEKHWVCLAALAFIITYWALRTCAFQYNYPFMYCHRLNNTQYSMIVYVMVDSRDERPYEYW